MEVITFQEIPTKIVEVPKIVLPTWAKVVLVVLSVATVLGILYALWESSEKKKLAKKLQESTTSETKLRSDNQKLGSDNQKLTTELNRYTGGRPI